MLGVSEAAEAQGSRFAAGFDLASKFDNDRASVDEAVSK